MLKSTNPYKQKPLTITVVTAFSYLASYVSYSYSHRCWVVAGYAPCSETFHYMSSFYS